MARFHIGFVKEAATKSKGIIDSITSAAKHTKDLAGAAAKGFASSGDSTIKDALKLKQLHHVSDAVGQAGGMGKALGTSKGRKLLAQGVGKAAPSIAAGSAYLYGGKKLYDKTLSGGGDTSSQQAYYGY